MSHPGIWDSGERVAAEAHNTLYLELLSAYAVARPLASTGVVLDIGSGGGYGAAHLAASGRRVLAIDYDPAVAVAAARRWRPPGLTFASMDALHLGVREGSVALACAFQVIEHLPDAGRFVDELARVLGPAGIAIVSTPNALTHRGPRNPFHVHEFTPDELSTLLRGRFRNVQLAGQRRPPEVYRLEEACQAVRRRDRLGLRHWMPRRLVSLAVGLLARLNGLTPPQRMSLSRFTLSPRTDDAYSLFALCSQAPLPEAALVTPVD